MEGRAAGLSLVPQLCQSVDGPCATRLVAKYTVTFAIGSPALRPAVIHGTDYAAIAAGLIDKNRVARDNRVRMKSEGI